MVSEFCHLRLTDKQKEIAAKILALDPEAWNDIMWREMTDQDKLLNHLPSGRAFPNGFIVASGPSTGKSAIVLNILGRFYRDNIPAFVIVPLKLVRQWEGEAKKFADAFLLPPPCIVHHRLNPQWKRQLNAGYLAIVPKSIIEANRGRVNGRPSAAAATRVEFFAFKPWQIAFADEAESIGYPLIRYNWNATKDGRPFHMISLNASKGSSDSLAVHASDPQLGSLPDVETLVQYDTIFDLGWDQDGKYLPPKSIKPYLPHVMEFIQQHRGPKTIVLCEASKFFRISPSSTKNTNYMALSPYKEAMEELGAINICPVNSDRKTKLIQQFAEAKEGILVAPYQYLKRGFHLPVSDLIILSSQHLAPLALIQILGRIKRVESPFRTVRLSILQNVPIGPSEIAFHALAASGKRDTDDIKEDATYFAKDPRMMFVNNGSKRRRIPPELANDLSIEGRINLFSMMHPDDALYIKEATRERLVVHTRIE